MGAYRQREIWDKELQENLGPKNRKKRQVILNRKGILKVGQLLSVWYNNIENVLGNASDTFTIIMLTLQAEERRLCRAYMVCPSCPASKCRTRVLTWVSLSLRCKCLRSLLGTRISILAVRKGLRNTGKPLFRCGLQLSQL